MKNIIKAMRKGWLSAGVPWRKIAVECNINPDKFMTLQGANGMAKQVASLPKQQQVIFFNLVSRKYPCLRINQGNFQPKHC